MTAFYTDKYEFTMLAAALESGAAHKESVFEVFARRLPAGRQYGVVAGVNRVLDAIENFTFTEAQIEYLRIEGLGEEALSFLSNYRFKGDVIAFQDGELYFPYSPILTVKGTFAEAVILETVILSILNHDCAIAGAASRMSNAAQERPLIEMGSRRTHEESAVASALSAYIGGFTTTSNVAAGNRWGIPVAGTSAHAFILAHSDEVEAFQAQVNSLGVGTTLLVDTYDIRQGIHNAVAVAGTELGAIRIDSGDLYDETVRARALLDLMGAVNTKITVSSDIDEYAIDELLDRGAPIDSFGVGTRLVTGSGHPTASMVYKLVAIEDDSGRMNSVAKASSDKISVGGQKESHRLVEGGQAVFDYIQSPDSSVPPNARPLAVRAIECGVRKVNPTPQESREHHQKVLKELPRRALSVSAGKSAIPNTLTEHIGGN